MKFVAYFTIAALAAGCVAQGDDGDSEVEQEASTTYVDIIDFPGIDASEWYSMIRALDHQFDQECGDTFCEGDWTNIVPLTLSCSVSSKAGSVRDCVYTFAAVDAQVDTRNA